MRPSVSHSRDDAVGSSRHRFLRRQPHHVQQQRAVVEPASASVIVVQYHRHAENACECKGVCRPSSASTTCIHALRIENKSQWCSDAQPEARFRCQHSQLQGPYTVASNNRELTPCVAFTATNYCYCRRNEMRGGVRARRHQLFRLNGRGFGAGESYTEQTLGLASVQMTEWWWGKQLGGRCKRSLHLTSSTTVAADRLGNVRPITLRHT